jgi:hypothetical protein
VSWDESGGSTIPQPFASAVEPNPAAQSVNLDQTSFVRFVEFNGYTAYSLGVTTAGSIGGGNPFGVAFNVYKLD